jgi:arabinofuranosyltransferase
MLSRSGRTPVTPVLASLLVGIVLLVVFSLMCVLLTTGGLDDSFITYRYAKHLAQGHGILWNVGEPPVEGYTSFLWVLLNSIPLRLGGSPLQASKVIATASAFAIMLLALLYPGPIRSRMWRTVLAALVATCPLVAFYAHSGMETVFFTAVLFAAVLVLVHELSGRPRPGALAVVSLLFGISAITRPEGVLMFGLCGLLCLSLRPAPGEHRLSWRELLLLAAPFLAVWLTYFLWRLQEYGWLFPNTYYAKHSGNRLQNLPLGLNYLLLGWSPYLSLPVTLLGLLALMRSLRQQGPAPREVRVALRLGGICLCYLLYIVWVGGDDRAAFPSMRLILPVLPVLWLSLMMMFDVASRDWTPGARSLAAPGLVLLMGVNWGQDAVQLVRFALPSDTSRGLLQAKLEQLGREQSGIIPMWIQQHTRPDEFIAVPWAGRVPYFSERPTIDTLGLNDVHIAHQPSRQRGIDVKMDPAYVLARRPKLIFINVGRCYWTKGCSFEQAGGWKQGDRETLELLRNSSEYEWVEDAPGHIAVFRLRERVENSGP